MLGVPGLEPGAGPILRPGLGRPLILTTLEPAEAMRLLASGRRGTAVAISALLAAGVAPVWPAGRCGPSRQYLAGGVVRAASPAPTAAAAGDPRSGGQGPGLVGDPLAAIVLVVAIGLVSVVLTAAYVRLTGGARRAGPAR